MKSVSTVCDLLCSELISFFLGSQKVVNGNLSFDELLFETHSLNIAEIFLICLLQLQVLVGVDKGIALKQVAVHLHEVGEVFGTHLCVFSFINYKTSAEFITLILSH